MGKEKGAPFRAREGGLEISGIVDALKRDAQSGANQFKEKEGNVVCIVFDAGRG